MHDCSFFQKAGANIHAAIVLLKLKGSPGMWGMWLPLSLAICVYEQ